MVTTRSDPTAAPEREAWRRRSGLLLAMAGSTLGFGCLVRVPGDAVRFGGGAFLLAYAVVLLLVGLPLVWMEWAIGRRGGTIGYTSAPGILQALARPGWVRYAGALGIALPTVAAMVCAYVASWSLGFAFQSLTGSAGDVDPAMRFQAYLGTQGGFLDQPGWQGSSVAYAFFVLTGIILLVLLARGLTRGLEAAARILMPLLILAGGVLALRVLTLPEHDGRTVLQGLALGARPGWRSLFTTGGAALWVAAAGQVFAALLVGSGLIPTLTAALRDGDDIPRTSLAAAAVQQSCILVLGCALVLPAVFLALGRTGVPAGGRTHLALAFVSMPAALAHVALPGLGAGAASAAVLGVLWFGLLFIAGLVTTLALCQPVLAFLRDALGLSPRRAVVVVGLILAVGCQPMILLPGVLEEFSYWIGVGLLLFATLEVLLVVLAFGGRRLQQELQTGSRWCVPALFRLVLGWLVPAALLALVAWWCRGEARPMLLRQVDPDGVRPTTALAASALAARVTMLAVLAFCLGLVAVSSRRGHFRRLQDAPDATDAAGASGVRAA